ncbi:MAG TPA: D-aminoacyl-tRNA deacylase [Candidatus Polarisedimenticolaceae bacterium]
MKTLLQRVSRAEVRVDGVRVASIGPGLLVLVGVERGDTEADVDHQADKTAQLRIFPDDEGKMNRSLEEAKGSALVVSQFTLAGSTRRGRRPSFDAAAPPETARTLYARFAARLRARGVPVETGIFQATMEVELVNDGPVTILLDPPGDRGTP